MNYKDYQDLAKKIDALYVEMSQKSTNFKDNWKVQCVVGCGKCCKNPNVYSSPLEMLPLSIHLVETKSETEIDELLVKLQSSPSCVFYLDLGGNKGKCTIYQYRGVVCRLFGWTYFSGKKVEEVSLCGEIKKEFPETIKIASNPLAIQEAPKMEYYNQQIIELDPNLGDKYPINLALKVMLEKLLLVKNFPN